MNIQVELIEGCVVTLRSGSPKLTIKSINHNDKTAITIRFDKNQDKFIEESFNLDSLVCGFKPGDTVKLKTGKGPLFTITATYVLYCMAAYWSDEDNKLIYKRLHMDALELVS
ncbi:hypothetical protein [Myroides pelagicus]|uniref:Uncharacterized protein n=1 Tax=Myroides pelagicus TaxID=270914 RepID=A0A7K1GHC3_9FLAO|nr:hypothetical protein [Myroides pelagicus]MTH28415.1 hypothetical protein [Myroides pelagicus]